MSSVQCHHPRPGIRQWRRLSAIYILVALGFTLLFGIMRVVNFAHGEFAMLGAFALFHLIKD